MDNKRFFLDFVLIACTSYIILFVLGYQSDWLMYLIKEDTLSEVEANVEKITYLHSKRSGMYKTTVKYYYNEQLYEQDILSDVRDWKADKLYIFIDSEQPDKIYRDKIVWIPWCYNSFLAIAFVILALWMLYLLHKINKEKVKDYKEPNE